MSQETKESFVKRGPALEEERTSRRDSRLLFSVFTLMKTGTKSMTLLKVIDDAFGLPSFGLYSVTTNQYLFLALFLFFSWRIVSLNHLRLGSAEDAIKRGPHIQEEEL